MLEIEAGVAAERWPDFRAERRWELVTEDMVAESLGLVARGTEVVWFIKCYSRHLVCTDDRGTFLRYRRLGRDWRKEEESKSKTVR